MADLDRLYNEFCEKITLTKAKRDDLIKGRDALRDDIRDGFSGANRRKPKFCMQGSFSMKTTINPLPDDEYDLDDGIYLQGYSDDKMEDWPKSADVHQWIVDAVNGHTKSNPEDKTSCVRVKYAKGYHIDLPSYIIKNDVCYLSTKKSGWQESDPKAFREWFMNYVTNYPLTYGEQLRRTVRYLKAWRDYCKVDLTSIAITILATEHFCSYSGRDDMAVFKTVESIYLALSECFLCKKPVTPYEELLDETPERETLAKLEVLKDTLLFAIDEKDEKTATEKLRSVYGDRFPLGKTTNSDSNSTYAATPAPGVIGNDGRSA